MTHKEQHTVVYVGHSVSGNALGRGVRVRLGVGTCRTSSAQSAGREETDSGRAGGGRTTMHLGQWAFGMVGSGAHNTAVPTMSTPRGYKSEIAKPQDFNFWPNSQNRLLCFSAAHAWITPWCHVIRDFSLPKGCDTCQRKWIAQTDTRWHAH